MASDASLDKPRHIRYWTRCLKTLLPHQYTSNDSNRMYLAYFIVAALDLLDVLDSVCTHEERQGYVEWIYHCQHPAGGFRMWPGTDLGDASNADNAKWDPANVPATYFALASLLILRDDLKRVNRRKTLHWISQMQRPDGSFGETLVDSTIQGGHDPRYAYCATGVLHILNGPRSSINIPALTTTIRTSQSYNGGIADEAYHEPHAGYTYCALGALSFTNHPIPPVLDTDSLTSWLTSLQTTYTDPDSPPPTPPHTPEDSRIAGFAGRENKPSDTCYAFWVTASLHLLSRRTLYDTAGAKRYLLEEVQHTVLGGFGKFPGDVPDLYHSYLGLAALSLAGCEGIKELDAGMCLSKEVRGRLDGIWKGLEGRRE